MAQNVGFHESFDRSSGVKVGSERNFGLVLAGAFTVLALLPLRSGGPVRVWMLVLAAVLLGLALLRPGLLFWPNRLWARVGAILHKVVTPVILFLLFSLAITPTGLFLRWIGRDSLRLRLDRKADTYWLTRDPPGPEPQSMRQQF